jgi:hypothetical protein
MTPDRVTPRSGDTMAGWQRVIGPSAANCQTPPRTAGPDLFVTCTGSQKFTASDTGYTPATGTATITAGRVTTLGFSLAAPGTSQAGTRGRAHSAAAGALPW